jgi:DNA-binding NarL/FixJ family response regulator
MKILLVDDHTVVREGVRRLLASSVDAILFDADSSKSAQAIFAAEKPDVVVLDLNLPGGGGGLDLLRRFLTDRPDVRVLIFSMHSSATYVMRAMQAGAYGYITKSASAAELVEAIQKVASGLHYLQRDLVTDLAGSDIWTKGQKPALSTKELDILRLLAQGKTLSEIARDLGAPYKTIANACTGIKNKLMVERTGELIRIAIEMHSG